MPGRSMQGVFPILTLPVDAQGRIVHEDMERQVEWFVDKGVHGMAIGMATEVYKLTEAERDEVLTTVVRAVHGRVPVVMSSGGEGTDVAVHYSKRAEKLGADALMIRPPTSIPIASTAMVEYFGRIAEAVGIPIFLQDYPNPDVPPTIAVQCARRHENLRYIKVETPPTIPRIVELSERRGDSGLVIFGGMGGKFFLEELRRGSVGTMPGSTLADMFVRVWDLWHEGEQPAAEDEFQRHATLIGFLGQGPGIGNWVYKHIMLRRGVFSSSSTHARHPASKPDDTHFREIDRQLERLGLMGA